ncbi:leucyl aminopeptidase [Aquibium sp. A9E412]|uniref:leucyl aminopeptidase n=1 Tax=Aquibium sp. A9E412 TaxID=2976767 RepID=UPI0025B1DD46|nr:leucyl aminopeptidase [Aquibium sp. A9E412]MDN2565018.1 leucyl aminopeptidase [Aquibium sp. A9E412]
MAKRPTITFAKPATPKKGTVVVLMPQDGALSPDAAACDPDGVLSRASKTAGFSGKPGKSVEVLAPGGSALDRLVAVGVGKPAEITEDTWLKAGGAAAAAAGKATEIAIIAQVADAEVSAEAAAALGLGVLLRSYAFDKYKTRKDEDNGKADRGKAARVTVHCADPAAAKKAFARLEAIGDGVMTARDLVNEPANVLGPQEFADRARELRSLGVEVEILTEKELGKLGMRALLAVGQGSARPPRVAVMRWNGGKARQKPVAFIGKGVVFDTGGISIKPAGGMEDMKGDMAGAATVVGLMQALAGRSAKVNAVGIIGLVENMPDGLAQRPGDIVTSMSGQTIEVINTDAEGRLVLADLLWYCNDRFAPQFMVNLATLTGAILVALGNAHAGLFSNDDELAERLTAAGRATAEKVWRMPLGSEYDKLIDSKFADMKNVGGRHAGAITAAQFLQRFVKDTPWAHLDVAGTAMASPSSEVNRSWGSGYGVRLLDRLVADHYEG